MSQFWSTKVQQLEPYVPGEQPQNIGEWIKLNTNENPYPPSKNVEAERRQTDFKLQLYPDPMSRKLCEAIARFHEVDVRNVFVGNGSDEVLAHAFHAFFIKEKPLLTVDISYSFYRTYTKLYGINNMIVPLQADFSVDIEAICAQKGNIGGFIIANPNAPTTLALSADEVEQIVLAHREVPVIIDEAYVDFGGESVIHLTKKYNNLLVTRTFSKSRSLAGMRLGYAIGSEILIEGLRRIKDSFNSYPIDRVTETLAIASIEDDVHFQGVCQRICQTREYVKNQLEQIGFNVLESKTNFLFISYPTISAQHIFEKLREASILVRYFNEPRIDQFLRVTIGTDQEMEQFVQKINMIVL